MGDKRLTRGDVESTDGKILARRLWKPGQEDSTFKKPMGDNCHLSIQKPLKWFSKNESRIKAFSDTQKQPEFAAKHLTQS